MHQVVTMRRLVRPSPEMLLRAIWRDGYSSAVIQFTSGRERHQPSISISLAYECPSSQTRSDTTRGGDRRLHPEGLQTALQTQMGAPEREPLVKEVRIKEPEQQVSLSRCCRHGSNVAARAMTARRYVSKTWGAAIQMPACERTVACWWGPW